MNYLTKNEIDSLPSLYNTENISDPICQVRLFLDSWSWYIIEIDKNSSNLLCFGYVCGFEKELGYFSLEELSSLKNHLGLSIKKDIFYVPKKLSIIKRLHND